MDPVTGVVVVGTWSAVLEVDIPPVVHVEPRVYLWNTRSQCAHLQLQLQSVPLVVTQLTLDKGRNGSHSIICKVTCCLLSLFLLHSFYLYLNVLGNLRTNVQVKMQ